MGVRNMNGILSQLIIIETDTMKRLSGTVWVKWISMFQEIEMKKWFMPISTGHKPLHNFLSYLTADWSWNLTSQNHSFLRQVRTKECSAHYRTARPTKYIIGTIQSLKISIAIIIQKQYISRSNFVITTYNKTGDCNSS